MIASYTGTGFEINEKFRVTKREIRKTSDGKTNFLRLDLEDSAGGTTYAQLYEDNNTGLNINSGILGESIVGCIVNLCGLFSGFTMKNSTTMQYNIKILAIDVVEEKEEINAGGFQTDEEIVADLYIKYSQLHERSRDIIVTPWINSLLDTTFFSSKLKDMVVNCPAAINYHHAYTGGLVEHTTEVFEIAVSIADTMSKTLNDIDYDIVYAAAILHDYGKIYDYAFNEQKNVWEDTVHHAIFGHISMGFHLVYNKIQGLSLPDSEKNRANNLLHCILSHHGTKEWGSPVVPATVEARIVFTADEGSAKIDKMRNDMHTVPEGGTLKIQGNGVLFNPTLPKE